MSVTLFSVLALGVIRLNKMRSNRSVAAFGDVYRGLRLFAEGRWDPARVLKAIYGLMTRVAPISYGTVTSGLLLPCRRTLGSERHQYAVACPDRLGSDPIAYGGLSK